MADRSRFFSSSNPFVSADRFASAGRGEAVAGRRSSEVAQTSTASEGIMTVQGTMNKTLMLSVLLMLSGFYAWNSALTNFTESGQLSTGLMWVGLIGGLVTGMFGLFRPRYAFIAAPLYALFEGLFLGVFSLFVALKVGKGEGAFVPIVGQAIGLTLVVVFAMGLAYKTGLLRATETFRSVVTTATMAIAAVYLISLVGRLAFGASIPYLHEGGIIGIGLSLFIVGIASLNLILDFDNIEQGAAMRSPKYMEWAGALGLMFTIVWVYVEILRLLMKLKE